MRTVFILSTVLVVNIHNMTGFATRTGKYFLNKRPLFMRHNLRHASSILTFKDTFSSKGMPVGHKIDVVTHKTPYAMYRMYATKQDLKDLTERDKDVSNLEKIVEDRAWLWHDKHSGVQVPFINKPDNLKLDWSSVKILPDEPAYDKITHETTDSLYSKVAFAVGKRKDEIEKIDKIDEIVYFNATSTEQIHKIRTERKAVSSYQATIDKGITSSGQFHFRMAAPTEILKVASEFSEGLSLSRGVRDTEEQIVTRFTEEYIRVPSKTGIKVLTQIQQKEDNFKFKTLVAVEGYVEAYFYDRSGKQISVYYLDIQQIICEEIPDAVEDNDIYKIHYEGHCNFKYGTEQVTLVSEISEEVWESLE